MHPDFRCAKNPGILTAATLRTVYYQRTFFKRHTRQPARYDLDPVGPEKRVWAEVNAPRLQLALHIAWRCRKADSWLRDEIARLFQYFELIHFNFLIGSGMAHQHTIAAAAVGSFDHHL